MAARHDILVPSLVADRRVEADQARDAISAAEQQFTRAHPNGAAGSGLSSAPDGTGGRTITCPVCFSEFSLSEAADHEHLRPASARGASRTPEPVE